MSVGAAVVRHLTGMVKHKLCKARNVFINAFKEAARKTGGVRWGMYHEMCEQINRIGLADLRDKYASIYAKSGWSKKLQPSFLNK